MGKVTGLKASGRRKASPRIDVDPGALHAAPDRAMLVSAAGRQIDKTA
jgi:hypothetical protein